VAGDRTVLVFETLDSTNEEAHRQSLAGARGPLWVVARVQTRGRGRSGRPWHSPQGNLYASLLLTISVPPSTATQLSFVAALAAYDAAAEHLDPSRLPGLKLKWPNDLLLDGAKLGGVLIESAAAKDGQGLTVIAGIGINVAAPPGEIGRPACALGKPQEACMAVFESLARAFEVWLARWNNGAGFQAAREAWLARAFALGQTVSVNLNGPPIQGTFLGIDPSGALLLETAAGSVITINAGEIHPHS
jgi:BirA family biotin operon repressor/biotin-[acetyl-CoA-carboxylase] ligase